MVTRHRIDEVLSLVSKVFETNGFTKENAILLARNCVTAEADGSTSHGLFRVPHYVDTVKSGYANSSAVPSIIDAAPGLVRVDGDNGFAFLGVRKGAVQLTVKARANGIAIMQVFNSHHLGALYLDIEEFAREGFVALAVVSSGALVAPPGGKRAIYGTNPMAFAAPRESGGPIFFDQSSSTIAYGEVQMAARHNRTLSPNTGIDSQGNPTGDPNAILDGGALLTFSGHKGASIALLIEVLCSGLVGADFSYEVDRTGHPGAKTSRTGETIILIDPSAGHTAETSFASRMDELTDALRQAGQDRIPGERRLQSRQKSINDGIEVDNGVWSSLEALAIG